MVLLGILSLFQAWIIPGFLFLLFFRNIKIIDNIVLSIPLSLILNYILIYTLVVFKFYNQTILSIIIFIELVLIVYILIRNYGISQLLSRVDIFFSLKDKNKLIKIEFSLINLTVLLLFIIYCFYALKNLGFPIQGGDPLDLWNEWALLWSKNQIPYNVEYPQAVPVLYSISYVLISNYEIEYFTSAVCIIYPIWIFVIFFRLSYLFPEKKILIKLSLIITTFFLFSILRNYALFIGYSDPILVLTATGVCFIFVYYFFKNKSDINSNIYLRDIILISLIASTPAITKQMGLLISFVFPIFFLIIRYCQKKSFIKNFLTISLIIFILSFSWYIFPIYEYSKINFDSSTTHFGRLSSDAMGDYKDMSVIQKVNLGLDSLFWKFKYLILILLLLSLNNRYSLIILFLIVLPYFFIWSLFFIADNRNFLMVSPFLGFVLSVGLLNLINFFSFFNYKLVKKFKIILILTFTFLFAFFLQEIKHNKKLISKSIEDKKLRGFSEVNILLYNYLRNTNPEHDIVTISDRVFTYLPNIGDRFIRTGCSEFINLADNKYKNKEYYLLLNKDYCDLDDLYKNRLDTIKMINLFDHKKHQFYFIAN